MNKRIVLGCGGLLAVALIIGGLWLSSSYNGLVRLDQAVKAQWAQVENVYQRRADLIPNLVETVKGAANFEQGTLVAVTEARAKIGQISAQGLQNVINDPEQFKKFQEAQGSLSSALSRLLVVTEQYPDLKATQAFRDLQVQLEGAENRITVERMRFNEVAQTYNTKRNSFPTIFLAGLFGARYAEKPYFKALEGADAVPKVKF